MKKACQWERRFLKYVFHFPEKNFASSKPGVIFSPMLVSEDALAGQYTNLRNQVRF